MQSAARLTLAVSLTLVLATLAGAAPASGPAEAGVAEDGDSLSRAQAQVLASEYHVTWQNQTALQDLPAAWQAPNRAHGFRTYFVEQVHDTHRSWRIGT